MSNEIKNGDTVLAAWPTGPEFEATVVDIETGLVRDSAGRELHVSSIRVPDATAPPLTPLGEAMTRAEMFANCHGGKQEVDDIAVIFGALTRQTPAPASPEASDQRGEKGTMDEEKRELERVNRKLLDLLTESKGFPNPAPSPAPPLPEVEEAMKRLADLVQHRGDCIDAKAVAVIRAALGVSCGKRSVSREWVQRFIPCRCIDAYKDRGLSQPDCPYHSEDIDGMLRELGILVEEPKT